MRRAVTVALFLAAGSALAQHQPYAGLLPEPAPRQVNVTSPTLQIDLSDGTTTTVADASIALSFDGSPVTPVKTRNGSVVTVTYTPTGLRFPGEHHTASLSFTNSAGATPQRTVVVL